MAKANEPPPAVPSTDGDDDQMAEFWERMEKTAGLTDERLDAALDRWLAKNPEAPVGGAGSGGTGRGAAPVGDGGVGGAGGVVTPPVTPRSPQPSGGSFLDVISRVALGKNPAKP